MLTPFETAGKVKVISVALGAYFGKDLATVKFVEDHPYGYKKDSIGHYVAEELKILPSEDSDAD